MKEIYTDLEKIENVRKHVKYSKLYGINEVVFYSIDKNEILTLSPKYVDTHQNYKEELENQGYIQII